MGHIPIRETKMTFWYALALIPASMFLAIATIYFAFEGEVFTGQVNVELGVAAAFGFFIGLFVALGMISETQNLYFDTETKMMTYTEPLSPSSKGAVHTIGQPRRIVVEEYKLPGRRQIKQVFLHIQCGAEGGPTDYTIPLRSEREAYELAERIAEVSGAVVEPVKNKI